MNKFYIVKFIDQMTDWDCVWTIARNEEEATKNAIKTIEQRNGKKYDEYERECFSITADVFPVDTVYIDEKKYTITIS